MVVQSPAAHGDGTPGSPEPVLCTRLLLDGATQTGILRAWISQAPPAEVAATAAAHFAAVDAAMGGFAAALGFERLSVRLLFLAGTLAGLAGTVHALLSGPNAWPLLLRTHGWVAFGVGAMLLSLAARTLLRWRLRRRFRRGPTT